MKHFGQVISGILVALLSTGIIFGSLSLALVESHPEVALVSATPLPRKTLLLPTFTPTRVVPSPLPGEPTFTPSPTATPSSTPTLPPPPTSCLPPNGWSPIKIQPGDTLSSLAKLYGTTPKILSRGNCLTSQTLVPGAYLYVPGLPPTEPPIPCGPPKGWVDYVVKSGDTLYRISQLFGISVAELQFANCLGSSSVIRVGQKLFVPNVPTRTPQPSPSPKPTHAPTKTPAPKPTSTPTKHYSETQTPGPSPTGGGKPTPTP